MTDADFAEAVSSLRRLPFREDFEAALYDLYAAATPAQRVRLRDGHRTGSLGGSKTWRNPADYDRSDLTREQHMRQRLIAMSMGNGGPDFRDDLMSIAYCYHNLVVRGVDADAVLTEVAEMSAPEFAELVLDFVRRSPEQKSLRAWRLEIVQTPSGPIAGFTA